MYACVILYDLKPIYSSFHNNAIDAIKHAQTYHGVIAVEQAHTNTPPIWIRRTDGRIIVKYKF